jgi:hypothetical protein
MSGVRWDQVPDSEVRSEVEAVLENQGETRRIRTFLNQHPAMADWRNAVRDLCRDVITQQGMENVTADILYKAIVARAHELIPPEVSEEVKARLVTFLQTQFEDCI